MIIYRYIGNISHIKYYILYIVTNQLLFLVLSVEDSYRVAIVEDKGFLHHSRVQKNWIHLAK